MMMNLGEFVEIHKDLFKEAVVERGFSMQGVVALMKSYTLNESYLSHRVAKGSVPINVFKAACKVIGVDFHDYVVDFDLSDVPSYQMEEELERRKGDKK
jgi:hypothetical protein